MTPINDSVATFIGTIAAALAAALGLKKAGKLSITFGSKNGGGPCVIKPSSKTGGAMRISEEGLKKIDALTERIDGCLTEKEHGIRCTAHDDKMELRFRDMFDEFSTKLDVKFDRFDDRFELMNKKIDELALEIRRR